MNLRTRPTTMMLLGLLAPILTASCGGGGAKPLTTGDFCKMWAGAVCQISSHCGATLTLDACTTAGIAQCMDEATRATSGGVRAFTAANVGTAVSTAMSVFAKTAPIPPTDLAKVANTASYVFQGTVAKMATCTSKYDCAGAEDAVICDKGVCAASATKASGAGCSDPGAVCDTASYCSKGTTGFYTCVVKGDQGATCDGATPCKTTLACLSGKCATPVAAAGDCTSDGDCISTAPYCDVFAGGACDTGLLFAPGSESCKSFFSPSTIMHDGGAGGGGGGGSGGGGAGGAGGSTDATGAGGSTDATGAGGSTDAGDASGATSDTPG
jgi:hypothetical protein